MVGPGVFGLHGDEVLDLARHEVLDLDRVGEKTARLVTAGK